MEYDPAASVHKKFIITAAHFKVLIRYIIKSSILCLLFITPLFVRSILNEQRILPHRYKLFGNTAFVCSYTDSMTTGAV